jgi:hypothetical protein
VDVGLVVVIELVLGLVLAFVLEGLVVMALVLLLEGLVDVGGVRGRCLGRGVAMLVSDVQLIPAGPEDTWLN